MAFFSFGILLTLGQYIFVRVTYDHLIYVWYDSYGTVWTIDGKQIQLKTCVSEIFSGSHKNLLHVVVVKNSNGPTTKY